MRYLKLFEEFLDESFRKDFHPETSMKLEKSTDLLIHFVLSCLLKDGGNNNDIPNGPDLFINFTIDDAKSIASEFNLVYNLHGFHSPESNAIDKRFKEHGLKIEQIDPDETIVYLTDTSPKKVEEFYRTKETKMKEIEKKHNIHFTSKRYGL